MSVRTTIFAHQRQAIMFCVAGGLFAVSVSIAMSAYAARFDENIFLLPDTVKIDATAIVYQPAGDFTLSQSNKAVDGPRVKFTPSNSIEIMKYQVTTSDYQRCVDDGTCQPLGARFRGTSSEQPAVDLNWHDADDYANWLSRKSGSVYRLPTDEEWIFAAGERSNADGRFDRDQTPVPFPAFYVFTPKTFAPGSFGANRNGIFDIAGNVWEWTSTCLVKGTMNDDGAITSERTDCGIRVAEGNHRAYLTDIVRDPKSGGCVGIPPTHLGFRLVREPRTSERLSAGIRRLLASIPAIHIGL
jgi:formylglycine-generating enzyme required for sulfatase activity